MGKGTAGTAEKDIFVLWKGKEMTKNKFVLTVHPADDDPQSENLADLLRDAKRLRRQLNLEAVDFEFDGIQYTVTELTIIRRLRSEVYDILPEKLFAKVKLTGSEGV